MKNKRKILYIEDMKECYEKTSEALGKDFEIDWKKNYQEGVDAIYNNLEQYSAGVFDVNLDYDSNKPPYEQAREGLDLIKMIKKEARRKKINIPIICASSNGNLYKAPSLIAGADAFLWKRELWEKGKEVLEDLIRKA